MSTKIDTLAPIPHLGSNLNDVRHLVHLTLTSLGVNMRAAGATWEEVEAAALVHMKEAGAGPERIQKSLDLVRTFPMSAMFSLRHLR